MALKFSGQNTAFGNDLALKSSRQNNACSNGMALQTAIQTVIRYKSTVVQVHDIGFKKKQFKAIVPYRFSGYCASECTEYEYVYLYTIF